MVAVEFKVESMRKRNFQLKLSKYGRFLYLKKLIPAIYFDTNCVSTAEAGNVNFHKNSTRAVAFDDLIDQIKNQVDTSEEVYGPAQTVRLLETCDTSVEFNSRLILWRQKPKCRINGQVQYDTFLMVELESKVKAKKKVVQKDDQVYGFDSSDDEEI